jgi:hypothetical protein
MNVSKSVFDPERALAHQEITCTLHELPIRALTVVEARRF